jgi:membrane protein
MAIAIRGHLGLLKHTALDFWNDDCPRMAAALSYYTVFSLPPLLILLVTIAGVIWDPEDIRAAIEGQMGSLVGPEAALQVRTMIGHAESDEPGSIATKMLGAFALIFGGTGAFIQMQTALNDAWKVEPDPSQGGIRNFIVKRVFSFALILFIAFMLLISLALTAGLSALGDRLGSGLPETLMHILEFIVSFAIITALFGAMFKVMPDAVIAWRDVWVGAIVTSLLFVGGKFALAFYLGRSDPGSAFGAAGSLALILVWIYYASMILLFGAEFTEAWATERGGGITAKKGATRVIEEKKKVGDAEAEAASGKEPTVDARGGAPRRVT